MAKSEVYSWRVAPETKTALEHAARRERSSISRLLDRLVRDWLTAQRGAGTRDEGEQVRRRAAAAQTFGAIGGGEPSRAERARTAIRQRLQRRWR